MNILVIGKDATKNFIRESVDRDSNKILSPKDINSTVLQTILDSNREFDRVVFSLDDLLSDGSLDMVDVKKYLISFLKKYGSPDRFVIIDAGNRLGSSTQLSTMALLVNDFSQISILPIRATAPAAAPEELDEFDRIMQGLPDEEKEISLTALDEILKSDGSSTPIAKEPHPVVAVQPEGSIPTPVSSGDSILDEILGTTPAPISAKPVPDDDIMSIFGPDVAPARPSTAPADDIFGGDSDDILSSILNSNPNMPAPRPDTGIRVDMPAPSSFQPSSATLPVVPNVIPSDDEIPDSDEAKGRGGIRGLIDNIIGGNSIGNRQLPVIPADVLPSALARPYILTFWASKGGTGKTTVALNTCAYISSLTNLKVILVDVDEFGDTGLSMGMEKQSGRSLPTVDDFINHISSMKTFEDVAPFVLTEVSTNLHVLLTSENSSTAQRPTKSDYQSVLRVLQNNFDIIAFDCGDKLYDEYTRLALSKADFIIMVVDQGFPTLSHMSQIIEEFSTPESGIGRDKLIMVVNKYQKQVGMQLRDINTWFETGVSSVHWIPAIFHESMKMLNQGELIILSNNMDIKQAYNRIVSDILRKIKQHQATSS